MEAISLSVTQLKKLTQSLSSSALLRLEADIISVDLRDATAIPSDLFMRDEYLNWHSNHYKTNC